MVMRELLTLVTVGGLIASAGSTEVEASDAKEHLTLGSQTAELIMNGHGAPFTAHEILVYYGLDPYTSAACQDDPNTLQDERARQDCLDVWNACNGNPQKPETQRVVGCLDGYDVIYDGYGRIVDFTPRVTGFNIVGDDGSQVWYSPEE